MNPQTASAQACILPLTNLVCLWGGENNANDSFGGIGGTLNGGLCLFTLCQ